jgi:ArsR family transcriptional regulator
MVEISKYALPEMARVFRALADENRLAILQLLRRRCGSACDVSEQGAQQTVSEIAEEFDLALSTVSHHIKELRNAGLILCEKQGQRVHCSMNYEMLAKAESFLQRSAKERQAT